MTSVALKHKGRKPLQQGYRIDTRGPLDSAASHAAEPWPLLPAASRWRIAQFELQQGSSRDLGDVSQRRPSSTAARGLAIAHPASAPKSLFGRIWRTLSSACAACWDAGTMHAPKSPRRRAAMSLSNDSAARRSSRDLATASFPSPRLSGVDSPGRSDTCTGSHRWPAHRVSQA
jgi:hypothetical protein